MKQSVSNAVLGPFRERFVGASIRSKKTPTEQALCDEFSVGARRSRVMRTRQAKGYVSIRPGTARSRSRDRRPCAARAPVAHENRGNLSDFMEVARDREPRDRDVHREVQRGEVRKAAADSERFERAVAEVTSRHGLERRGASRRDRDRRGEFALVNINKQLPDAFRQYRHITLRK